MGNKELILKLPTDYSSEQLKKEISKKLRIKNFTFQITNKSLDARKKNFIHWNINLLVFSDELKGNDESEQEKLEIPYKKREKRIAVVGSGPAGFFSAYVLQKAGFKTIIIERGSEVNKRSESIDNFEKTAVFNSQNNYAFGEGGAGTFSDGKLTSRSKHISKERQFILDSYIQAGAPKEIAFLKHPHLGSDNLKIIVQKLREQYISLGGEFLFETMFQGFNQQDNKVKNIELNSGNIDIDYLILGTGHSAYETYRMLIKNGIKFRPKNFAIGSRIEHPQEIINQGQWGKKFLPGVKAAEYRLTAQTPDNVPIYTFCMCPGGIIVPAAAYENTNIVNGMSLYMRNGEFANSACVAGVNPEKMFGSSVNANLVLDWVESLEQQFFEYSNSYKAPFCSIESFINKKMLKSYSKTTYPMGIVDAPLWELLPEQITNSMRTGLVQFSQKIKGFETGNIMGLESKTSAPIQVLREKNGLCEGFENLYVVGEGSGYAGGIISSAADGIKAALEIIANN